MSVCYIVGAAPECASFSPKDGDLVIAADGGQKALLKMNIAPHLVVGDFDSSDLLFTVPCVKHPVEKDDTDTALAIREGAKRGYRTFCLYGCMGGRPDHTFGAIQTALGAVREGLRVFLVGEGVISTVIVNESFRFECFDTVSVFSLSDVSKGVSLSGLKYSLSDATLSNGFPLGVSNEGKGDVTVSVREGELLLMWKADTLAFADI